MKEFFNNCDSFILAFFKWAKENKYIIFKIIVRSAKYPL